MSISSNSPIIIPRPARQNELITARHFNEVIDAVRGLVQRGIWEPTGGAGHVGERGFPPFFPKSVIREPDSDPAVYNVRLQRGWVIDRITNKAITDDIEEYLPQMEVDDGGGGTMWVDMDADEAVLVVNVDEWVYCKYKTDEFGVVQSGEPDFPQIVTSASDEASTHYQPEDDVNLGQDGEYWCKLFKIEADGDDYNLVIYQQSDIEHYHELPTFENLGDGKEIFKQRNNDKYEFLGLTGNIDTEPGSSFTEADVLIDRDGAVDLASATNNRVRVFVDTADLVSHPWKVTANGDDTVAVAAGELLSYDHEGVSIPSAGNTNLSSYFNLKDFASYAGGNVTVLGAGVIYAEVTRITSGTFVADTFSDGLGDEFQHWLDSVQPNSVITVKYGASLPSSGDVFTVKLAEVSLNAGNAEVDKQIITHNPTLWIPKIQGFYNDIP